jgi:hypothetical protein
MALAAQTITGSITGTAADPSGAVVANVKITATNTATNLTYTANTNETTMTVATVVVVKSVTPGNENVCELESWCPPREAVDLGTEVSS